MAQDEIDDRYRPDPEPGDDELWPAPPEMAAEAARWESGPDAGYPHDPGMNMACEYGVCDHREAPHIAALNNHTLREAEKGEPWCETSDREVPGAGREQIYVAMSREVNADRETRFAAGLAARQAEREGKLRGLSPDKQAEHARLNEAMARRNMYLPPRDDFERDLYREWAELDADVIEAVAEAARADREAEP